MAFGSDMMQERVEDGTYRRMDFLHLSDALDLNALAAALRPLVGADFEFHRDHFVECMVSNWDGREVIVAHPLEASLPEHQRGGQLTENNAATYVTLALKRPPEDSGYVDRCQHEFAASIATTLATTFDTDVLHSKTWEIDRAKTTLWNRRYGSDAAVVESPRPVVFASGWKRHALATTIESLRPKYDGPLDFLFVVHPRSIADRRRPFPLMRGLTADRVTMIQPTCTILGPMPGMRSSRFLITRSIVRPRWWAWAH